MNYKNIIKVEKASFNMMSIITLFLTLLSFTSFTTSANNDLSCLHITKTGKGPIVFLIPGFSNDSRVWQQTTEFLAEDFEVHNISLAGFGATPACGNSDKIYNVALTQIQQYAEQHALNDITVIGHSMGGLMSMDLAITAPELFTRVVSVDGLPFIGPVFTRNNATTVNDLTFQANQMAQFYKNASAEQISQMTERGLFVQTDNIEGKKQIIDMAKMSDPITLGSAILSVMTRDLRKDIIKIKADLLLVGASGGFQTGAQHQQIEALYQHQVAQVPKAQVMMNQNSKHFVMYDDVIWLNNTIKQFLTNSGQ